MPNATSLVIKELKEPLRDRKKVKNIQHNGNISIDNVYEIARIMAPRSMAREFKGTVKEILGTAVSVGCTVDGEDPRDIQQQIDDGDIDGVCDTTDNCVGLSNADFTTSANPSVTSLGLGDHIIFWYWPYALPMPFGSVTCFNLSSA